jgi:hypothetical protein
MPNWHRRNKRLAAEIKKEFTKRIEEDMAIVEPPIGPEGGEAIVEEPIVIPDSPPVADPAFRDVCAHCMRPLMELESGVFVHLDPRIDHTRNPAWHLPERYSEPPVRWGFLNTDRRSLTVDPKKQWS